MRSAVALRPWPGAAAERVEQLVTKTVEEKIGENSKVTEIKSISAPASPSFILNWIKI